MSAPIIDVAGDMLMYLIFAGFMQSVLTAGVGLLGLPLLFWGGWPAYRGFIARVLVFSFLLYVWGCLGTGFFETAFRDRIYINRDSVGDFVPWLPSTDYMVDTSCGGHPIHGATWNTLRLAWTAVAVPVWLVTFLSYAGVIGLRRSARVVGRPA
ncbi:MAG TPA: hypothetical protein VGM86_15675 [Thermoanaerobaculia bacterium]|jgi:hypothetical protein